MFQRRATGLAPQTRCRATGLAPQTCRRKILVFGHSKKKNGLREDGEKSKKRVDGRGGGIASSVPTYFGEPHVYAQQIFFSGNLIGGFFDAMIAAVGPFLQDEKTSPKSPSGILAKFFSGNLNNIGGFFDAIMIAAVGGGGGPFFLQGDGAIIRRATSNILN